MDYVEFSAALRENFILYVQLQPAIKVTVFPLPDPSNQINGTDMWTTESARILKFIS